VSFVLIVGACAPRKKGPPPIPRAKVTAAERQIIEILLLQRLPELKTGRPAIEYRVICVGVDGKDPSARLLARLKQRYRGTRLVRGRSACALNAEKCVQAVKLGLRGQRVGFSRVRWLSGDRAQIDVRHYICPRISGVDRYLLRRIKKTFIVLERAPVKLGR
jgi:hypothetical protein